MKELVHIRHWAADVTLCGKKMAEVRAADPDGYSIGMPATTSTFARTFDRDRWFAEWIARSTCADCRAVANGEKPAATWDAGSDMSP